ncbi:MAG: hypothetical protein R3270_00950 [Gammaproteobacteria bacterium]|nr:hypothetical protein [Gammaproteobacteria bacterium]
MGHVRHALLTLVLSVGGTLAGVVPGMASPESVVNERLPVSRAEIEARWGIDCESAIGQLRGVILGDADIAKERLDSLAAEIRLCAFLDQAHGPGKIDYFRIAQHMNAWRSCTDDCPVAAGELRSLLAGLDMNQGEIP